MGGASQHQGIGFAALYVYEINTNNHFFSLHYLMD